IEAAVLMEAGWQFFDEVWVVVVEPETAIARVTASRGMTADEVQQRLAVQMTNEERIRRATRVIHNDGTPAELRARVEGAWAAAGSSVWRSVSRVRRGRPARATRAGSRRASASASATVPSW